MHIGNWGILKLLGTHTRTEHGNARRLLSLWLNSWWPVYCTCIRSCTKPGWYCFHRFAIVMFFFLFLSIHLSSACSVCYVRLCVCVRLFVCFWWNGLSLTLAIFVCVRADVRSSVLYNERQYRTATQSTGPGSSFGKILLSENFGQNDHKIESDAIKAEVMTLNRKRSHQTGSEVTKPEVKSPKRKWSHQNGSD